MEIKREEIEHIANLSMLNLSDEDITRYTKDMEELVGFANKINAVDTENLEESAFALDATNVFRKDEIKVFEENSALLANAPEQEDNMFKIPKVIERISIFSFIFSYAFHIGH